MANNNEHTWQAMLDALSANQVRFYPYRGLHKDIDAIKPSASTDGSLYFAYDDGYIFLDKEVTENGAQIVKRFTMGGVGGSAGGGSSGFVYANATMNGESPTLIKEYSDLGDIDSPSYFILEQAFHFKLENRTQNITVQEREIYYDMYEPINIPESEENPWGPMPEAGTLVINTNGWIFRIVEKQGDEGRVLANLLSSGSASGGGGGSSGGASETQDLHLEFDDNWNTYSTFIEGKDFILDVFCTGDRDRTVSLTIQITDVEHNNAYPASTYPVKSGEAYHFNTAILPRSNNITITFSLDGSNARMPDAYKPRKTMEVKVVQMALNKSSNVTNHAYITGPYSLNYNIVGDSNEISVKPHLLIDGTEIDLNLPGDGYISLSSSQQSISIQEQEHGVHQIEVYLSSTLGIDSESIFYELAWVSPGNDTPLIWFDELPTTVVNYDNCIIKYNVYNPVTEAQNVPTSVNLLQEREPIPNSPISVQYSNTGWLEWDISALYKMNGKKDTVNSFSIACGAVRRDFDFIVTSVGERDLGLVQPLRLSLNLSSAGRSNNEESSVRKNWSYYDSLNHITYETTFENFNWFNNGWQTDGLKDGTFLAVANGARARINFKPIELNSTSSTTIELRFRVRNIQEYSTLVRTIARYNVLEDQANAYTIEEIEAGYYSVVTGALDLTNSYYKKNIVNNVISYELVDSATLAENSVPIEIDQNGQFTPIGAAEPIYLYTNHKYTMAYDADGNPIMNEAKSEKAIVSDKGVCFKYFDNSGFGFCIGTQEAFFKSRAGTANVRYKEEEIINLSFVIAGGNNDHVLYIYLNGILSGAIDLTQNNGIESINANYFEINSDYCDFDLYKLRVYDSYLSMPEVIHNYLSDKRDIELYDQNQLTDADDATNLLYTKVVSYNNSIKEEYANVYEKNEVEKYINKLTMPYAVIQTIDNISSLGLKTPNNDNVAPDDDRLPYNKDGGNRYVKITFVNPALDEALEKGAIDENFYYTHSPSYEAVGVDINVQGTSSQGYPRRNYKTKFKSATKAAPEGYQGENEYAWGWRYTKGTRAGTSFSSWHMDSVACSTNKFTWKIDYMESSGTYNTGFANLVGNGIYSKHPLESYDCFDDLSTSQYRTSVYGFPVMVFHKHSQKDDLEMYGKDNQEYKVYTYIGRYNLNLDKSSNEYYGFEIKTEHPYVNLETPITAQVDVLDDNQNPIYEYKPVTSLNLTKTYYKLENDEYIELDVEDIQIVDGENITPIVADGNDEFTLNGTDTPIIIYEKVKKTKTVVTREKKTIAEVAECWELRDNQGTWTSFKYPLDAINDKFSTVDSSGILEVTKHFEYRYNVDADALDDAYEKKDDPSKTAVKWHNGKVNLSTQSYRNEFLIKKHSNLERLFDWLYSTDTSVVPAEDNSPNAVQLSAEEKARQFDEQIYYMVDSTTNSETNVTTTYLVDSQGNQIILLDNEHVTTDEFGYLIRKDNDVRLDNCIAPSNYTGTKRGYTIKIKFNTDCAGYRLHKFQAEFAQHLDLEYCIKYFILTELLLCYDSRGKNMMLATWGPQEEGGEYIWFPIFYDIDTQLGLNNIGAVLWDYNADATLDGDFSTANSVLWVNLWGAFRPTIEAYYRELRKGQLKENTIEGAYLCDPEVFTNSYAMKGVRPVIALGLDEYYKYILPGSAAGARYQDTPWKAVRYSGFINSEGGAWSTNNGYLYTCQGDRKLSRELLIRNRLNYLDSWWLAGNYVAEAVKQGIMIRANANDVRTSDTFLDSSLISETVSGYTNKPYPVRYFDATPQFNITPFLQQYVTVFYDEDPVTPPLKYSGLNAVTTNTTPSVENGYRTIHPYNEQLTYIPGGDYVSSLGDLSLKYPSHFTLGTGARLVDVTLGSDIPGYNNGILGMGTGTFNLNAGANSANKKGLLQKIILTGISGLKDPIDITTASKLVEFRALGTNIIGVTFAPGAPLEIVHLPRTVSGLTLTEAKNLTRILTSTPQVMKLDSGNPQDQTAVYSYKPRETYTGLYIDGITNYTNEMTDELNFLTLNIHYDNLGYDSYKIMSNMIQKRIKTYQLDNTKDKAIALTLTGVNWCPYQQIESNAIPDEETEYYRVTDHGTFVPYTYTEDKIDEFIRLRKNEKLFILDSVKNEEKYLIQSLEYLDLFMRDHQDNLGINTRYRADNSTKYEIPNIQGVIFVDNDEQHKIKETDLDKTSGKYALAFPNLTIYANYIAESYVAKFIQEDDVGKENEFAIKRVDKENDVLTAPYPEEIPIKQNYDFIGWSLDPEGTDIVINYSEAHGLVPVNNYAAKCTFSSEQDTIVFYAQFVLHKYQMKFYIGNECVETVQEEFRTTPGIAEPKIVPYLNDTSLTQSEIHTWLGWEKTTNPGVLVDLSKDVTPIMDYSFRAVFDTAITSVYSATNILDLKYLSYSLNTAGTGYYIGLNPRYQLLGKITLPVAINGIPVVQLGSSNLTFNATSITHSITHIFWEPGTEEMPQQLEIINTGCFGNCSNLVYYEQPASCREIRGSAFTGCIRLGEKDPEVFYNILQPVTRLYSTIFTGVQATEVHIPGHRYENVGTSEWFAGLRQTKMVVIGKKGTDLADSWEAMITDGTLRSTSAIFNQLGANSMSGFQIIVYAHSISDSLKNSFGVTTASISLAND